MPKIPKTSRTPASQRIRGSTGSVVTQVVSSAVAPYANKLFSATGKRYYLSEVSADFHFIFESGERLPAHKLLLAGSNVFQAMFNGSWEEKQEVTVVDASVAAFKEFLQFFYLDDVKITMENVGEVMNLGNKYNVAECMNACSKLLMDELTIGSVCSTLQLAILFNRYDVKAKCIRKINFDAVNFLQSSGFLHCDKQILDFILKQSGWNCPENVLFEAVMSWVKAKTNQEQLTKEHVQAELGDLFYQFRFRSMTIQQFAVLIQTYGHLFTREEQDEIIQLIGLPPSDFIPKHFNADIRKY